MEHIPLWMVVGNWSIRGRTSIVQEVGTRNKCTRVLSMNSLTLSLTRWWTRSVLGREEGFSIGGQGVEGANLENESGKGTIDSERKISIIGWQFNE